ncbi:hypothetical protein PAXRUDRAFT_73121, partial [Paxillus rubicundulus Ve08.2h10]
MPFVDDVPVKSEQTHYQAADGSYKTIPKNPGIFCFIWNHCIKFILAVPDATIIGHKCTLEGRIPHEDKVQKIRDWLECSNVTHIRGFLGVCGVVRIFIKDFAKIASPLVNLTRKGVPFLWDDTHRIAMWRLKDKIAKSPALRRIDYECGREVILAVDTSVIAVGFILLQ